MGDDEEYAGDEGASIVSRWERAWVRADDIDGEIEGEVVMVEEEDSDDDEVKREVDGCEVEEAMVDGKVAVENTSSIMDDVEE